MSKEVLISCLLLSGCANAAAYGPSSDDRLDEATSGVSYSSSGGAESSAARVSGPFEAVAAIEATQCPKLAMGLKTLRIEDDQEAKLAGLAGLVGQLRAAKATNEDVVKTTAEAAFFVGKSPDGVMHNIPDYRAECVSSEIDASRLLDEIVRSLLADPVRITRVGRGRRRHTVSEPRADLDLLQNGIEVLNPPDKDDLITQVGAIKKNLAAPKARKGRHRK